jgi:hypothetical protein
MGLTVTAVNTIALRDTSKNINIQQSKSTDDVTADLNFVYETYNLPEAQADYQLITLGDIVDIREIFIVVTKKTAGTFAGVSVSFTDVSGFEILKITDSFTLTGTMAAIAVKNLDPTNPVTIAVVICGSNT